MKRKKVATAVVLGLMVLFVVASVASASFATKIGTGNWFYYRSIQLSGDPIYVNVTLVDYGTEFFVANVSTMWANGTPADVGNYFRANLGNIWDEFASGTSVPEAFVNGQVNSTVMGNDGMIVLNQSSLLRGDWNGVPLRTYKEYASYYWRGRAVAALDVRSLPEFLEGIPEIQELLDYAPLEQMFAMKWDNDTGVFYELLVSVGKNVAGLELVGSGYVPIFAEGGLPGNPNADDDIGGADATPEFWAIDYWWVIAINAGLIIALVALIRSRHVAIRSRAAHYPKPIETFEECEYLYEGQSGKIEKCKRYVDTLPEKKST